MSTNDPQHPQRTYQVVQIPENSCGLGDVLVALRDARQYQCANPPLYVLPRKAAHLATLFDGIAPVLVESEGNRPAAHPANLPLIELHPAEVAWAAISTNNRSVGICIGCAPAWSHLREAPFQLWQEFVVRLLAVDIWVYQCGLRVHKLLEGAVDLRGLRLRDAAAAYARIGHYIGIDTGDMHLALAVGATCDVAVPPSCGDYRHDMWHYKSDRIRYYSFDDIPTKLADAVIARYAATPPAPAP